MTTIIVKDPLRDSVEAASDGKQTVRWTKSGLPSYMSVIPRVNLEDLHPTALGFGPHPAFVVNGVVKDQILIGSYQAVLHDGEALSLPNQPPTTNIDFDLARAACAAAGPGFHLMTNWEWALLALMAAASERDVRGNTDCSRSHSNQEECGKRSGNSNFILTGSGPASWRHDGTMFGVSDLVGNVWEWNDGLKLLNGRILMPHDNDFTLAESEWPEAGACIDIIGGYPRVSDQVTTRDWDSVMFNEMQINPGFEVPIALRQALISPMTDRPVAGRFYADNTEDFEAMPFRGGHWSRESNAGLGALALSDERSAANSNLGFRPAFIE